MTFYVFISEHMRLLGDILDLNHNRQVKKILGCLKQLCLRNQRIEYSGASLGIAA